MTAEARYTKGCQLMSRPFSENWKLLQAVSLRKAGKLFASRTRQAIWHAMYKLFCLIIFMLAELMLGSPEQGAS